MTDAVAVTIEILSPEKLEALWPQLEPMFEASCVGNEIVEVEMTAQDVYVAGIVGELAVCVGYIDGVPTAALAIQFNYTGGHKCAELAALGGSRLMLFRWHFWPAMVEWFRANGVEFIDAHVPEHRVKMYKKKFGFTRSCAYIRMPLGESHG